MQEEKIQKYILQNIDIEKVLLQIIKEKTKLGQNPS